ncbi:MAG: GNAT family N-acetyltransferase [Deltaproteobacteria bacterium]|nr:GNAT family N-acetyltransferase [Deltaproteobacteria bacterium]
MTEQTETSVRVRPATAGDLAELGVLAAQLVRLHHAWDAARFLRAGESIEQGYARYLQGEMANDASVVLVAEIAGQSALMGYAFGRREPRNWELLLDESAVLHDLFVDERARRAGVGEALVRAFVERMRARGATRVLLHTAAQNAGGQALFARLGFRVTMLEMMLIPGELAPG